MTELKPCPFCGDNAMSYDCEASNFYPNYIVECCNCSARIKPQAADGYDAKEKTESLWNSRQPQGINWQSIENLEDTIFEKSEHILLFDPNAEWWERKIRVCESYEPKREPIFVQVSDKCSLITINELKKLIVILLSYQPLRSSNMKLPIDMPEELKKIMEANHFEPDDYSTQTIYELTVAYFNSQTPKAH